jgi:DNA sulfur modification protein DndC
LIFITNQVAADGEAIILIGTRLAESQQRAKSIKKHDIKESVYKLAA